MGDKKNVKENKNHLLIYFGGLIWMFLFFLTSLMDELW